MKGKKESTNSFLKHALTLAGNPVTVIPRMTCAVEGTFGVCA